MSNTTFSGHDTISPLPEGGLVPAAQYVRMSTDFQQYSLVNQQAAIRRYAARHHYRIVRTYVDRGKSGLRLEGREALQQLLSDALDRQRDFTTILVYDVSRWGRFQDPDEGAYYEFLCRQAGVVVRYCNEPFAADPGSRGSLIKALKRMMAGEYSRELSVKVHDGQVRLAGLGFRQGGYPGYGLRRMRLNAAREPQGLLETTQQKHLATDRVILVPGPAVEVAAVRWIFKQYTCKERSVDEIVEDLNRQVIPAPRATPWNECAVRLILRSEKYIGTNVYNRQRRKLKGKCQANPPEEWVRKPHAFPALIDEELFQQTQRRLHRLESLGSETLLDRLRQFVLDHHSLLGQGIRRAEGVPVPRTYAKRFGSLSTALYRMGPLPTATLEQLTPFELRGYARLRLMGAIAERLERAGSLVDWHYQRAWMQIDQEVTVRVVIVPPVETASGPQWVFQFYRRRPTTFTLVARLAADEQTTLDYYLFPHLDPLYSSLRLANRNRGDIDVYRRSDWEELVQLVRRATWEA